MTNKRTRCPYTRRPLNELVKVSREHVVPDAIGGADAYSVDCCRDANSALGTRVDAPLVNSDFLRALRVQHGIESRTGAAKWELRGTEVESGTPVNLTISEGPVPTVHYPKPVTMSDDGKSGTFIVTPAGRDEFVRRFVENHARKGKRVEIVSETRRPVGPSKFEVVAEMRPIARGLLKIAYLAAFEYLGDAFLDDDLNANWRAAVLTDDPVETTRLLGEAFNAQGLIDSLLPALLPHEHATVVANLQVSGPTVAVTLFGKSPYSLVVSEAAMSNLGLAEGEGQIVICDSKARTVRRLSFLDHLSSEADRLFGPDGTVL